MLSYREFSLLTVILERPDETQRTYATLLRCSLGTVNKTIKSLQMAGFLDNLLPTPAAMEALKPYRVDNAIIMAAGMSKRFVPMSLEKPKGLYTVKGEILIERQLRQLQEAGITDITIVVGYLKEQFFYLEDKFGVTLRTNEDYYRYNNTSTLMLVTDKLANTFICSSDNYFTENVFTPYVYRPYYAAVYSPNPTQEYILECAPSGKINKVNVTGGKEGWYMLGHAYFDRAFSQKFVDILTNEYTKAETRDQLWEQMYSRHTKELPMYIQRYDSGIIYEFDSLDELRLFDPYYIANTDSAIFHNICKQMQCTPAEISGFTPIKEGLTNISFRFCLRDQWYVYRHPGKGTEAYIDRMAESKSMSIAKQLGLDKTFIHMGHGGWKISHYKTNARNLDYRNLEEVRQAICLMKRLHETNTIVDYDFDIWRKAQQFVDILKKSNKVAFQDFDELHGKMVQVAQYADNDNFPKCLCHCDCYAPNFMVHDEGMELIDWEYSGNDDPANDIGTFICCAEDYGWDDALEIFNLYYGRTPTEVELRHCTAYVAIASWYWFVWALFQESLGKAVGKYLHIWYKGAKFYANKALELYQGEN